MFAKRTTRRILGIDPGSRHLGIAILDGENLVLHDVLTVRNRESPQEILAEITDRLAEIIATYRPDLIAIERTVAGRNRRTAILDVLFSEILALARRERIPVMPISPSTAKKFVTGFGWSTKAEVASAIVARWYPELRAYVGMLTTAQAEFHFNKFDAIAVARCAGRR